MENYFMNSEKVCVGGSECGENNYPALESRSCEPCNEVCKGCTGPMNTDCRQCADRYSLSNIAACEKIICKNDEYFEDKTLMCKSIYIYIYIAYLCCVSL